MSKRFISINGNDFMNMVLAGASNLCSNVEKVNGLNVFPVPDGDTGTNMNLTLTSGVEELKKRPSAHIGKAAEALSKGLLMGARGNSGVILSQLFRGFAKSVHDFEQINSQQFAAALQQGVDTAYKAVVKPVEGTILTVSKEAAKAAVANCRKQQDITELMQGVLRHGQEALDRTPEQLPILKQVGVVDAGGQGLINVYEGFLQTLQGEAGDYLYSAASSPAKTSGGNPSTVKFPTHTQGHEPKRAQAHLATEDIEYGYCTEFILRLAPSPVKGVSFKEETFREQLGQHGDSLLVVADDDLVKIHIHAEYPGQVMNLAMKYGELIRIKIENMREQHSHILHEEAGDMQAYEDHALLQSEVETPSAKAISNKPFGFLAVAMGDGINDILSSVGVDVILSGGQTMNPSTEEIVNAVNTINADTVYILPNNSNIILAAGQASQLIEHKKVIVIPTKTIPQGMAAILAFQENLDAVTNTIVMTKAIEQIRSGQVTYAVRDTMIDGIEIKQGHFIGIEDGRIAVSEASLTSTVKRLLQEMLEEGSEVVTILTGADAKEDETEEIIAYLKEMYPEVEVELHPGGQPIYAYLLSVE